MNPKGFKSPCVLKYVLNKSIKALLLGVILKVISVLLLEGKDGRDPDYCAFYLGVTAPAPLSPPNYTYISG